MEGDLIHINEWLRPLSWLYEAGVWVRNFMFDNHLIKETSFPTPVICVGNITAGGTGKTPHTEYLLRLLKRIQQPTANSQQPTANSQQPIAVLSRGYKRKSRGFHIAEMDTPVSVIGDEPWQMKQKFPDVTVAVDANRRRGINHLIGPLNSQQPTANSQQPIILLDDAFQHRYVKAGLNILLTDYHRLITDDALLPAGRLREPVRSKERAHIVIVTKCPHNLKPMDYRVIQKALDLKPYQHLFFSTFRYGTLQPLFGKAETRRTVGAQSSQHEVIIKPEEITPETHVILLTGIASPQQMLLDLQQRTRHITPLAFTDHHDFTASDAQRIERTFTAMQGSKRLIVTTEKDAARLRLLDGLSPIVRRHIYVQPIEVEILQEKEAELAALIQEAIR